MNALNLVSFHENKRGQNVTVAWRRDAHTRKTNPPPFKLEKQTVARVTTGKDHERRAGVVELRESGKEAAGLSGKEWKTFPLILSSVKTGKEYLRVYPGTGTESAPLVQWFADGKPVAKSDVAPYLLASETNERERDAALDCFDVGCENIVAIGEKIETPLAYL